MDSYDNDWIFMLDDDLFPVEESHVEEIQPQPPRFDCGRLYCPFDLRGDGPGLEHGA